MTAPAPAAALAERLERLAAEPPYRHYLEARDAVLRMHELTATDPSAYWREELAGAEYLLDASPLVIEKLRHHSYHVTGLRVYDYRSGKSAARERLAAKLERLRAAGDDALLVPEDAALGGFGFDVGGALHNVDTLKFFEVMLALDRGGLVAPLRAAADRRLVWEIGAGWGGFARVFRHAVPNATYVIVDLPELFLFSGTYLRTVFPDARVRYWAGESAEEMFRGWEALDFVFVPAGALDAVRPPRLDLAINMVSFQEMTTAQVRTYVGHAADLGAPALYSLNRDRSPYNSELTGVRGLIGERFRVEDVEVLPVPYTQLVEPRGVRAAAGRALRRLRGPAPGEYRHVIGRRG